MNVYLLITWDTRYYVHEIATLLQTVDKVDKIGARVSGREPYQYLLDQSDVEYDVLHCVQDVHRELSDRPINHDRLRELKKEYGRPFLTTYKNSDRNIREFEHIEQKRMIQKWFDFYIDLFDDFKPDVVLTGPVAASHTRIPFDLVQHRGGTAFRWGTIRIGDRYAIRKNSVMGEIQNISRHFESLHSGTANSADYSESRSQAVSYLESFRTEGERPGYFSTAESSFSEALKNVAIAPVRYLRYAYLYHISRSETNFIRNDHTRPSVSERIQEDARRSYRKLRIEKTNYFDSADKSDDFVFFPLHYQPESALMIGAPMYTNQVAIVKQVSDSLPIGHKLYVKEHPMMGYQRKLSYYDRLKDIPNVRVLDPRMDSHDVICRSDLVTTITGTAGFEATMLKTPVITFGDCFYNGMPMVSECRDLDNLSNIISQLLEVYKHDEEQLRNFLTAIFECSFEIPSANEASATERAQAVFPHLKKEIFASHSETERQ